MAEHPIRQYMKVLEQERQDLLASSMELRHAIRLLNQAIRECRLQLDSEAKKGVVMKLEMIALDTPSASDSNAATLAAALTTGFEEMKVDDQEHSER
ncbi:hypothetical protein AXF42_Ash013848 [Apostasia shenzhenica]|uniref:Uncharacterized protein n=1 Tax=Apostasia shenzhenica TaxID=1088818 RepID=A0A2I0AS27_9ASPA|nr:hypothetical protein AXF42_Ash013848 [Apostasia shenzhenica]